MTSGMKGSFETDSDPEKPTSYTLATGDSQTEQFSCLLLMPVTSKVSVSLQSSCFGQAAPTLLGLDVVRALDVIPMR